MDKNYIIYEISTSNMAVRSYGPDTDIGYVCTVILGILYVYLFQLNQILAETGENWG